MKLNNHGWSMKEMIIFCSILLVFLLIAVFNIMRLYHGLNSNEDKNSSTNTSVEEIYTYEDLEEKLLDAGLDYYNEYSEPEDIKITTDQLIKKKLLRSSDLKPEGEKNECKGYVLFEGEEPLAYIKCQNYKTSGYKE